jgi:hypothetical protein
LPAAKASESVVPLDPIAASVVELAELNVAVLTT